MPAQLRGSDDAAPRAVFTEDLSVVIGILLAVVAIPLGNACESLLIGRQRARVDFVDNDTAGDLEQACVRIDGEPRERFPDLDEVFIQPVPPLGSRPS